MEEADPGCEDPQSDGDCIQWAFSTSFSLSLSLYDSPPAECHECRKDAQEGFIQKPDPQYSPP